MAALSGKNAALAIAADKHATAAGLANQKRLESAKLKTNAAIAASDSKLAKTQQRLDAQRHSATMRQLREETKAHDLATAQLLKTQARQERESARFRSGVGKVAGGALGTLGGLAKGAIGAAGLGGSVLLAASVSKQLDVQKASAELANQASNAGDKRSRKDIQSSVLGQAGDIAEKTGHERTDIIQGMRSFVEISGDMAGAQRAIASLTQYSDASGAELSDVAKSAAIFSHQLKSNGLKGKELDDALDKVMRSGLSLSGQGSIEFKDVAKIAAKVQAASGRVGGDPVKAITDTMALTQLAIFGGADDAEGAGTSVQRMTDDIYKNRKKIEKGLGHKVFDKKGNLNMGMREFVLELMGKTGGDPRKLTSMFGMRGFKSLEYLAKVQRGDTSGLTGDQSAAGKAFLKGETSKEEVQAGAEFRQEQADRQLTKAFDSLYAAVGTEMVPILVNDFIPALKDASPIIVKVTKDFAKALDWLAKSPWEGLGLIVGAAIAKAITTELVIPKLATGAATAGEASAAGAAAGKAGLAATAVEVVSFGAAALAAIGSWALVGSELAKLINLLHPKTSTDKPDPLDLKNRHQDLPGDAANAAQTAIALRRKRERHEDTKNIIGDALSPKPIIGPPQQAPIGPPSRYQGGGMHLDKFSLVPKALDDFVVALTAATAKLGKGPSTGRDGMSITGKLSLGK